MSDNIQVNINDTAGKILATKEDLLGAQHEKIIQEYIDGSGEPVEVSATTPMPVTDTKLTDGTQETQIVDSLGNKVTVTANRLDVNATVTIGDIEIGKVKLLDAAGTNLGSISAAGALKVDNSGVTQPVSAASLPLPSGAATGTKQDTGNASLSSIDGKITAVNTGAVVVSSSALPTGAATSANQATEITSLANIDADLGAKADTSATTDTGTFSLIAFFKRLLSKLTTQLPAALGNTTMAASLPVTIASNQTAVPISGTVTVDTSLLATATKQDTGNTSLSSIDTKLTSQATATKQDTGNTSLGSIDTKLTSQATSSKQDTGNTSLSSIDTKLTSQATAANQATEIASLASIDAGIPTALGQATMANSMPVVISSNQSAIPISGTVSIGATDNTTLYSNNIVATGAIAGFLTTGYASIVFQFSGTWNGNLVIEGCNDDSGYTVLNVLNCNELSMQDVIYGDGNFQLKTTTKYVRLNVLAVTGTITALIVGRTVLGISAVDSLSMAMDSPNNPLYVAESKSKKDISNALIPSDAMPLGGIYGFAVANTSIIFAPIDTTGYQSIVIQSITATATFTVQTSNDGVTWASLFGYSILSATASANIGSAGIYTFPALGKFVRGLMAGTGFTNCLVYLRQQPVNPFNSLAGGSINIQSIGGSAPPNTSGITSVGGISTPGGIFPVGSTSAPSSTTVPYPIMIGGREAPSDGALGGKVRILLTDTLGKAIVTGDISAASSNQNVKSVPVQDTTMYEGQSQIEILAQILLELKINNQMMSELPLVLQGNGKFDEPQQFRNDQSLFAV